jgi:Uncharacterized conserved protein (DUF2190)
MADNVCTPYYEPGGRVTGRATGSTVLGKRFVAIAQKKDLGSRELDTAASGGNVRIVQAAANDPKAWGVAEYDAADGKVTTVLRGGFVVPIVAGVVLAAGDLIAVGAGGKAVKVLTTERVMGISLSDAVVDGDAIVSLWH